MPRYAVALRHDAVNTAPPDWRERVAAQPGVTVARTGRVIMEVDADDAGLQALEAAVGAFCVIEPEMGRRPL